MYRIRPYSFPDRAQVGRLLCRLWSRAPALNEQYLEWRYERNPYLRDSLAVAEIDGRIAAVRGAYGMRWRIGTAVELIPCLGDTVVHRDHEGRGLVQKLSRHLLASLGEQGVRYVVNQSPGKLVEKISLRTGWRRVGFRKLTRCDNPGNSPEGFERLDLNAARLDCRPAARVSVLREPPADLPALMQKRATVPPIGHHVDGDYIRWRFRNPFSTYRWVCAYDEGPIGFVLLAASALPYARNRFRILDLWGLDSIIQADLLRKVLEWGQFPHLLLWWNRFPRHVAQVLLEHNFQATADELRNPTLLIRRIDPDADFTVNGVDLLNMNHWDARMIHSDVS